jgi:hypothetical protein
MKRSREAEEAKGNASSGSRNSADSTDNRTRPSAKIVHVARSGEDDETSAMKCALPPHKEALNFASYEEYESHYNQAHTNRCSECRKNFPAAHLLNLHVEECHDPFMAQKRDKGEHTVSFGASLLVPKRTDKSPVCLLRGGLRAEMSDAAETAHASHRQAHVPEEFLLRCNTRRNR